MKRILFFAALVLGMVSCQKDHYGLDVDANGEAAFTLKVALPETATRAAGENSALGGVVNLDMDNLDIRYILEVYNNDESNKNLLGTLAKERMVNYEDDAKETSFSLRLIPGRDYRFVVWADFVAEDAQGQGSEADNRYNTSEGLKKVTLANNSWSAIDESRDAYTNYYDIDNFSSTSSVDITLTRPFAKLRVVTNDIKELYGDLMPETATVKYFNTTFRDSFNAFEQVACGDELTGVELTANLAEQTYGNENPKGEGEMTLFADYFFAPADGFVMFNMDVVDNSGQAIPTVTFNTNIPVQRNHLTTVYGPILTDANNIVVRIDDVFEKPENIVEHKEASSAKDIVEIFSELNESTNDDEIHIVLADDINLDDLAASMTRASESTIITIKNGKTVVLDLNGKTLSATDNTSKNYSIFDNRGTFTVKNGRMELEATINSGWDRYSAVIANNPGGNLTVENATIEHLGGTDMAYGIDNLTNGKGTYAVTTIKNATVKSTYRAVRQFLNGVEATNELYVESGAVLEGANKSIFFHDPGKNANTGKLVVSEGATLNGDVYLFVTAGSTEWPVEVSIATSALANGSVVTTGNVPAGYALVEKDGAYVVEYGVEENGNQIKINNIGGLKWVASKVNSGADYFKDKTIVLANDIDLNNEEWTPIGSAYADHGFMGNFDGNGYAIKNLTIKNITPDSDGFVYAGLFGVTEGVDKDNQNYIKNLTIENVDIELGGDIVAAAIAYPYYTNIENVTVNGNVYIKGGNYTAGVLAYTRRCVDAKNIAIEANEGSVIEGNITVGGVISDIQMNGGLTANYSNFAASGLTIKGEKCVGGISGIIYNQTLNGATVKNVTIDCADERRGIVAGSEGGKSTITNASYENVSGATRIVGATYDGGLLVVSTADELVAALEANKGVYLFNDITIDPAKMSNAYGKTGINVKNGQTINGGGHTLNINGAGGTWDSGIATTGGLIKDITVTGAFRGIFIKTGNYTEKVVLENVTITGTTYTISCDEGKYQGIEATNCTFNGWTSFAKTAGEAKFTNCYFGQGSGYKYCRPYSNTEFVKCTFCPGFTVDTTRATVTFTDCTFEE